MDDPESHTAPRRKFEPGRLVANVMHFARVLRAAGLPVGPGKVLDAIRALEVIDLGHNRINLVDANDPANPHVDLDGHGERTPRQRGHG